MFVYVKCHYHICFHQNGLEKEFNYFFSLTGHNLLMFYNKAPFDPELTANTGTYYQGFDYFMPPSLRSFGFWCKS